MSRRRSSLLLRVDRGVARGAFVAAALVFAAAELSSESVTLTTYYPAPSGVYTQLIATSQTSLARDGGSLGVGIAAPLPLGVKMAVVGGSVGLGTTAPASALSVVGGIQPGDDPAACTAAKSGTLRWHAGVVQVCTGAAWGSLAAAATTHTIAQTYTTAPEAGGVATCPAGMTAVSGGVSCNGAGSAFIVTSYPANNAQWYAYCGSLSNQVWGTRYPVTATVYAQCQ